MKFTLGDALAMQARCDSARKVTRQPLLDRTERRDEPESRIRKQIVDYCGSQWPVWVTISARTDQPSTLAVGAHDLTIFGPFPLCILVELKRTRGGKLSLAQQQWIKKMEMLGWCVAVVTTWEQFMAAVNDSKSALDSIRAKAQ